MTLYFIDRPALDEPTLWRATGPGDTRPVPLFAKSELDRMDPILWPVLVGALVPHGPVPPSEGAEAAHRLLAAFLWGKPMSPEYRAGTSANTVATDLLAKITPLILAAQHDQAGYAADTGQRPEPEVNQ